MAWSTRELAELAGTTLRAVRHYHDIGLLDEPHRRSNGYKEYGAAHLVRLLRITRLTELGVPLAEIAAMGDADEHPAEALRARDAELAAGIERMQAARAEIGRILRDGVPTHLPSAISPATAARLTEADHKYVAVMSRVLGPRGMQTWVDLLADLPEDPVAREFDDLTDDADDETRQRLAEGLVHYARDRRAAHPDLLQEHTDAPRGAEFARRAAEEAVLEFYNDAQLDVLRRMHELRPDLRH
ncbi:MAG: MerR family transcriptional regulator [Dermatophilaceae bacterium]